MYKSQYSIIYSYFENCSLLGCNAASSGNYHVSLHKSAVLSYFIMEA